jgi:hypothetical protein
MSDSTSHKKEMTKVFIVPIRYWEEDEPKTGFLLKKWKDGFSYVHHHDYNHSVYIESERVCSTREEAIKQIQVLRNIRDMYDNQKARKIVRSILEDINQEQK